MDIEQQLRDSIVLANHRKEKQVEKVIFETNVVTPIALKYANGKRVESRYNDYEVYYSLTDGRAMYATPALDAKIAELAPQAGEEFTICKKEVRDGNKKRIEWQVSNGIESGRQTPQQSPAAPVPATPLANGRVHDTPIVASVPQRSMTQIMGGAFIAAIDALVVAQQYGAKKGLTLEFNEEDARACANSIFIAMTRDSERFRAGGVQ